MIVAVPAGCSGQPAPSDAQGTTSGAYSSTGDVDSTAQSPASTSGVDDTSTSERGSSEDGSSSDGSSSDGSTGGSTSGAPMPIEPVALENLGNQGVVLSAAVPTYGAGTAISHVGDVDGDGLDDVMTTSSRGAHVVFGRPGSASIDIDALGADGFRITHGTNEYDYTLATGAGDINGDGLADLVVADPPYVAGPPAVYVVFGKADSNDVDLQALGSGGFVITSQSPRTEEPWHVAHAGDVDGDGLGDVVLSSSFFATFPGGIDPQFFPYVGLSYVIFGRPGTTPVSLDSFGSDGFVVNTESVHQPSQQEGSSWNLAAAGDVNGDGLGDIVMGNALVDVGALEDAGMSLVIFGKADGATVDISFLGTDGFAILGANTNDWAGFVAGPGDVDGDGRNDLLVGAINAGGTGRAYVVFGKADPSDVDLAALLDGGFAIEGEHANSSLGIVGGAGDVDCDGLDDVIVGAPHAEIDRETSGRAYVVFGKSNTDPIDTMRLGLSGFALDGVPTPRTPWIGSNAGGSVGGGGDFDGDGTPDILVGAPTFTANGEQVGRGYVVFGSCDW